MTWEKRGVSGDLFKWLLAVIAGALLFVFFYRFAVQHTEISDAITERQIAEYLDDQLTAFGVSGSASTSISLGSERDIVFSCGSAGSGGYLKDLQKVIFAPARVEAKELAVWTREWSFPFPVMNFFYVRSPETRVILVYDDASRAFVQQLSIPKSFGVLSVHKNQFDAASLKQQLAGVRELHFVFLTSVPDVGSIVGVFPQMKVRVVEAELPSHELHLVNEGAETFFLGDEMLYGALFAPDQYVCLQEKALQRLHFVASAFGHRASLLRGKTSDVACGQLLFEASQLFKGMAEGEEKLTLYQQRLALEELNHQLTSQGCASAY